MLYQFLSPLGGMLAILVIVVAGTIIGLLKSHSALTLTSLVHVVSPPVAVGVLGIGMTVAMFTSGEVNGFIAAVLGAIMMVMTYRANAAAKAASEATASAREDRTAAALAAKEVADTAREDRATAALVAKEVVEAANAHAIALASIKTSVDGVASRKDDEVSALKKENAELRLRLAEAKGTAAILAAGQTAIEIAKASASSAPASAMSESAPAKSLEQIDKNTAETANNTARTEAVVQDLKDKA